MSSRSFLATTAFCLILFGVVDALCSGEPAFAPFPDGHKACINDPADGRNLELYLVFSGKCDQHATWYNSVVFWGTDDKRTTAEALETYTLPTGPTSGTMTFHYDVPVTALKPGEVAGMSGYAQDDENWRRLDYYVDWVQKFTPGAGPTSPNTGLVYETITSVATDTVTETARETTTPSVTVSAALVTKTVIGPRSTVTTEITITPLPRIITRRSVSTETTSVTCIKRGHHSRAEERSSDEGEISSSGDGTSNILARQFSSPGAYVAPGCGSNLGGESNASTSTITETHTVYESTTTTVLETATAVATSRTEETTSITPTRVKRHYTIADRPTKTVTRVYTTTQSVYPLGRNTRRCRAWHGRDVGLDREGELM